MELPAQCLGASHLLVVETSLVSDTVWLRLHMARTNEIREVSINEYYISQGPEKYS